MSHENPTYNPNVAMDLADPHILRLTKALDKAKRKLKRKQKRVDTISKESRAGSTRMELSTQDLVESEKEYAEALANLNDTLTTNNATKVKADDRKAIQQARREAVDQRSADLATKRGQANTITTSEYDLEWYDVIKKFKRFWHQQRVEIYVVDRLGQHGTWVHVTCEFTGKHRPDLLQTPYGTGGMPFTLDDKEGRVYCIKRPRVSMGLKKIENELTFRVGVPGVFKFMVPKDEEETKRARQGPLVFSHKGQYYYQTNDVYKRPPDDRQSNEYSWGD